MKRLLAALFLSLSPALALADSPIPPPSTRHAVAVYTAFGGTYPSATVSGAFQRYTFTGRESSAHNSAGAPMYYRNRMYSTALGRFGRRDPVLDAGNVYNAYAGLADAPVGHTDPFGTFVRMRTFDYPLLQKQIVPLQLEYAAVQTAWTTTGKEPGGLSIWVYFNRSSKGFYAAERGLAKTDKAFAAVLCAGTSHDKHVVVSRYKELFREGETYIGKWQELHVAEAKASFTDTEKRFVEMMNAAIYARTEVEISESAGRGVWGFVKQPFAWFYDIGQVIGYDPEIGPPPMASGIGANAWRRDQERMNPALNALAGSGEAALDVFGAGTYSLTRGWTEDVIAFNEGNLTLEQLTNNGVERASAAAAAAGLAMTISRVTGRGWTGRALSPEQVIRNPNLLRGRSLFDAQSELEAAAGEAWRSRPSGQGRHAGEGWRLLKWGGAEPTDLSIRYHTGAGGRHGGFPYWRVSSGPQGVSPVIPAESFLPSTATPPPSLPPTGYTPRKSLFDEDR